MVKKHIKRFIPDTHKIRDHKHLKVFGKLLHDPNLWHLNRYSVATAFSVGLFFAFVPVPFQMVLAAGAAIMVRSNLPVSVVLVWFTNPLTMVPIFYFALKIVSLVVGTEPTGFNFEFRVLKLIEKRVSASLAAPCYSDETPMEEKMKYENWFTGKASPERREKGAGRPTKRERRDLEGFKHEYIYDWDNWDT